MNEQETKRYRVASPLLADGKHYGVDDSIELPAETGEALAAQGVLTPTEPTAPEATSATGRPRASPQSQGRKG